MKASELIHFLEENHATDIVSYDIAQRSSLADHMLICTARSNVHARSLGVSLKKYIAAFTKSVRIEGIEQGDWILVDNGVVMVHIMQENARTYYDLDHLWEEHN